MTPKARHAPVKILDKGKKGLLELAVFYIVDFSFQVVALPLCGDS